MIIHDYRSKNRILSWSLLTTIILGTEFEPSTFVSRESIAKKTKIRYEVIKSGRKVSKVDPHYSKLKKKPNMGTKYLASYPILFSFTSQKIWRCSWNFSKIFLKYQNNSFSTKYCFNDINISTKKTIDGLFELEKTFKKCLRFKYTTVFSVELNTNEHSLEPSAATVKFLDAESSCFWLFWVTNFVVLSRAPAVGFPGSKLIRSIS